MLPPTSTGRTWARKSSPVSAVVVVLPFVPVMAMTSASIARQAELELADTGTPRARTRTSAGSVERHAGAHHDQLRVGEGLVGMAARPERAAVALERPRLGGERGRGRRRRSASTRPPTRRISRAAATPLFASPTTETVLPASQRRYAGPAIPVAPLHVVLLILQPVSPHFAHARASARVV